MAPTSTYVTLPSHILKRIIGYVVQEPNSLSDFFMGDLESNAFLPLVQICNNWRATALSTAFARCNIDLNSSNATIAYQPAHKDMCISSTIQRCYNVHVQSVHIGIKYNSIADGSAVGQLELPEYQWIEFPHAHILEAKLTIGSTAGTDPASEAINVKQFINKLSSIAPSISKTTLLVEDHIFNSPDTYSQPLGELINHLAHNKKAMEIQMPTVINTYFFKSCQMLSGLTTLSVKWSNEYHSIAEIVYRNSSTLQELAICYHSALGFERLIYDKHNKPIMYPNLYDLQLLKDYHGQIKTMLELDGITPFPKLKYLYVDFEYPFSDDVLFRSSSSALEKLSLNMDSWTIRLLNECNVYNHASLSSLEKLVLFEDSNTAELTCANMPLYSGFLKSCLPKIKQLLMHGQGISSLLHSPLLQSCQFAGIQHLSLIRGSHEFAQVVQILHLFPGLLKLVCRISSLGEEFHGMEIDEVFAKLYHRYTIISSSLQTWEAQFLDGIPTHVTSKTILLLAHLCPYLKSVVFPMDEKSSPETVYSKIAYSGKYTKFRLSMNPQVEFRLEEYNRDYIVQIQHHIISKLD